MTKIEQMKNEMAKEQSIRCLCTDCTVCYCNEKAIEEFYKEAFTAAQQFYQPIVEELLIALSFYANKKHVDYSGHPELFETTGNNIIESADYDAYLKAEDGNTAMIAMDSVRKKME